MAASILFVGNSFTYGEPAGGPPIVQNYQPGTVTDLNGTGVGGVPALFKAFTNEAGLNYQVSLETVGGVGVDDHYANKLGLIDKPWDNVVLQSYSTLDAARPGNPATLIRYSGLLADALAAQNPDVNILLDATWSRADQTYLPAGHWYGQSIDQMAQDVYAGYVQADQSSELINGVLPVGLAFNEAIDRGYADPNPYDGISPSQFNLWAPTNTTRARTDIILKRSSSLARSPASTRALWGQPTGSPPISASAKTWLACFSRSPLTSSTCRSLHPSP